MITLLNEVKDFDFQSQVKNYMHARLQATDEDYGAYIYIYVFM